MSDNTDLSGPRFAVMFSSMVRAISALRNSKQVPSLASIDLIGELVTPQELSDAAEYLFAMLLTHKGVTGPATPLTSVHTMIGMVSNRSGNAVSAAEIVAMLAVVTLKGAGLDAPRCPDPECDICEPTTTATKPTLN
jgi:hypothetical protein